MHPIFKLRPLTGVEIENLFDSGKFQIDYTKSIEQIEGILELFQNSSHFDYFICGAYMFDTEIGELLDRIIKVIHGKTTQENKVYNDTLYDIRYEKVSNVALNYFKTQNIKTLSIKRIDDIIRSQMYDNRASTSHFNFLKIKNQIDALLSKIQNDEEIMKYINELRINPSSNKLRDFSYLYEKDMESIFGGILDVTETYYILLKFFNLE